MLRARTSMPFFFFNDTATTEIYTLSLHDALPISTIIWAHMGLGRVVHPVQASASAGTMERPEGQVGIVEAMLTDRKSTRLNSSHQIISYAVFCLKKKTSNRVTSPKQGSVQSPPSN